MAERIDVDYMVLTDPSAIGDCSHLILPGVGHFNECVTAYKASGLAEAVSNAVLDRKKPVLGICVGYQMMARRSEEGQAAGLGWIAADVVRFPNTFDGQQLRVPHVGWNMVEAVHGPLLKDFKAEPRFYFTHSFYVKPDNDNDLAGRCRYGHGFAAIYSHDNIHGVQFHPEKSHDAGLELVKNFVERTS
jgi:glutamine amidotransferase